MAFMGREDKHPCTCRYCGETFMAKTARGRAYCSKPLCEVAHEKWRAQNRYRTKLAVKVGG